MSTLKIVVPQFMSLDGVVQAPGGPDEDTDGGFAHGGWSMPHFDPEVMGAAWGAAFDEAAALLLGRRTWTVSAQAWPEQASDPMADRLNALPKYVASRTLTDADVVAWSNSEVLEHTDGDAVVAVRALRERGGPGEGDALVTMGSASLVAQLATHDLVDEYRLMIEPVLLGGGKSVFPADGALRTLELVSATTAATGVLVATYRRRRDRD